MLDVFLESILQKLLTHKSPQMTRRYAELGDEAMWKVPNLAGDIIEAIQKPNGQVVQMPGRKNA